MNFLRRFRPTVITPQAVAGLLVLATVGSVSVARAQGVPGDFEERLRSTLEQARSAGDGAKDSSGGSAPAQPVVAPTAPPTAPSTVGSTAPQAPAATTNPAVPQDATTGAPSTNPQAQPSAAVAEPRISIRKGDLPQSKEYWDFQRWFRNQAVLNVIVSGADREHLADVLTKLAVLKERGVMIGDLIIVDARYHMELQRGGARRDPRAPFSTKGKTKEEIVQELTRVQPTELGVLGQQLGLVGGDYVYSTPYIEHYNSVRSPLWVVRYRGRDFVYEGQIDPKQLFDSTGQFLRGEGINDSGDIIPFYNFPDAQVPIASRESRGSSVKLVKQGPETALSVEQIPPGRPELAFSDRSVRYVALGGAPLPTGAGLFDGKADCEKSSVTLDKILIYTPELQWFDIVYYNHESSGQRHRAEAWPLPVAPYLEGDIINPYRYPDPQQDYARFFKIKCLPTRVRFVQKDDEYFFEYRQGVRAWDDTSK